MDEQHNPENGAQDNKPEISLDLQFVPTWARRPPDNPYVEYERASDDDGRRPRRDQRRGGFRKDDRRSGSPDGQRRSSGDRRFPPRRDGSAPPRRHGEGGPRPPHSGGGSAPGGFPRAERGESRPPFREGQKRTDRPDRPSREARGPGREGGPRRPDGGGRRPPHQQREFVPRLNVRVSFLPDRERLALVVRDIQVSRRAFPLIEIANRFLGREDLYLVKLEWPPPAEGEPRQTFVQCLDCHRVFRSRENAAAHVLHDHLDKFFDIEVVETEPPAGVFTCVARCRLSHTLLGPPNYHGYNEKLQELWSSRFSNMPKTEYLGHIETVRDEALVEQWKDSLRKKTIYRLKPEFIKKTAPKPEDAQDDAPPPPPPPPEEADAAAAPPAEAGEGTEAAAPAAAPEMPQPESPPMTRREAQEWMQSKVNGLLRESARCIIPGPQSRMFDDPALRREVGRVWQKESQFPFTLSLALRPAFRHMHLHLFKVNARETYVTAVAPAPVDLSTAPDIVKEIAAFLEANPGSTRQQVLEGLRPGVDVEAEDAAELLRHLDQLIHNGGVIEFFNATLTLARGPSKPAAPKAKDTAEPEKPAEAEETSEAQVEAQAEAEAAPEAEVSAEPVASASAEEPIAVEEPVAPAPVESAESAEEAPAAVPETSEAEKPAPPPAETAGDESTPEAEPAP